LGNVIIGKAILRGFAEVLMRVVAIVRALADNVRWPKVAGTKVLDLFRANSRKTV
jgi:hypothetical protein